MRARVGEGRELPGKLGFGRRSCRREGWRLGGEPEVREDLAHDDAIGEQRDQLACAAAMGADEDVDREHAFHQLCPTRAGWSLDLGSERWLRRRPMAGRALRTRARHDEVTPFGGGCQDSVIGEEMNARARYECREA